MVPLIRLRPVDAAELDNLLRFLWDAEATGEFQWFGYRMNSARNLKTRWDEDGLISDRAPSFLAVALEDENAAGWVTWRLRSLTMFSRSGPLMRATLSHCSRDVTLSSISGSVKARRNQPPVYGSLKQSLDGSTMTRIAHGSLKRKLRNHFPCSQAWPVRSVSIHFAMGPQGSDQHERTLNVRKFPNSAVTR